LQLIEEKRKLSFEVLSQNEDILSKAMCMKNPVLSNKELRDIVFNFLIAGRDTTAVLLTFTTYLLSLNPVVEEKILQEIDRVVGKNQITFENMKEMTYLQNVLSETLRLYPSVPTDGYDAFEDDVLPGNYFITKGSTIGYSAYVLGRSPEYFEDPLSFKPERWETDKVKPFSYLPFHVGPRSCLGIHLAYLEAKVLLCVLLPKLKFQMAPGAVMKEKRGLILTVENGLKMIVKKRNIVSSQ